MIIVVIASGFYNSRHEEVKLSVRPTVRWHVRDESGGNGKLCGEKIAVNHIAENSIAFKNKKHGFTYNSNQGSIVMTNNTSWNNGHAESQQFPESLRPTAT